MKSIASILFILLSAYFSFAQSSGISGKITVVVGNQMPGIQNKSASIKMSKEIYIYEMTHASQAQKEKNFYKNITTRLVTKKKSKADGSFKIKLKPGTYSVFIKEKEGLFANILDGKSNISPVVVESKKYTLLDLVVDHGAAY